MKMVGYAPGVTLKCIVFGVVDVGGNCFIGESAATDSVAYNLCAICRSQPPVRSSPAPRSARAVGFCSLVESDQAEGRDAVWCPGGVCDIDLRDGPWPAHPQTPGQASTGAQRTGKSGGATFWSSLGMISYLGVGDPSVLNGFGLFNHGYLSPSFQLILELCRKRPDEEAIMPHLERIRIPAAMSDSGHMKVVRLEDTGAN